MSLNPIKNYTELRKRLNRFLGSKHYARDEISALIRKIEPLGNVLIFGGMLRDLSLHGIEKFSSDVDLVIRTDEQDKLDYIISSYKSEKNRFGGYRISLERWKIDLWTFESTWAFGRGLVQPRSLESLCETTFFDWDAIAFDIGDARFVSIDGYIDKINSRIIDINLEANPNPIGNVIKAFRYREKYDARWSNRLARYVFDQIQDISIENLDAKEKSSHDLKLLDQKLILSIKEDLEEHQRSAPLLPFQHIKQKDLLS